ncbi:hypothetical protein [Thiohalorhabdus methylotrophus]|uniref:hypothetical protein n=1 Tax=Thiohalorhabdus methylotrophus TaxID=3242694 RepID=UPI0035A005C5
MAAILPHTGSAWGGDGEQLVEGADLVRFHVRDADVAQLFRGNHGGDGIPGKGEQLAQPGMEQHRFVVVDQVAVEAEAVGRHSLGRNGRADAVDLAADLVDPGAGLAVSNHGAHPPGARGESV